MSSIIGIDSRNFVRRNVKRDGTQGRFESVLGIAVKIEDYALFDKHYQQTVSDALSAIGADNKYKCYCVNDLRGINRKYAFLDLFAKGISKYVEKIHVFYTLFSRKHIQTVKVYGRLAKNKNIRLSEPTRTYEELLSRHLLQCFPAICAWRLMRYLNKGTVQFHLDAYEGHISEAQEELDNSGFLVSIYPGGDCSNSIISTADLLLELLDKRLKDNNKFLLFDNIRPALQEFGDNLLVYPILNKHLSKITPVDKVPIDVFAKIKHPVFWVFKGEELIDTFTLRTSLSFRNLQNFAAGQHGVVKIFDKSKDIDYFKEGDYGVHLNNKGKEIIESYRKIGKRFKWFDMDGAVPTEFKD